VSEGVVTGLLEHGYRGRLSRVASADTFIPLGPAAATVLLSEEDVVAAALSAR
jgi:2-oxoisovalerate dehydrogenase E1 component